LAAFRCLHSCPTRRSSDLFSAMLAVRKSSLCSRTYFAITLSFLLTASILPRICFVTVYMIYSRSIARCTLARPHANAHPYNSVILISYFSILINQLLSSTSDLLKFYLQLHPCIIYPDFRPSFH